MNSQYDWRCFQYDRFGNKKNVQLFVFLLKPKLNTIITLVMVGIPCGIPLATKVAVPTARFLITVVRKVPIGAR